MGLRPILILLFTVPRDLLRATKNPIAGPFLYQNLVAGAGKASFQLDPTTSQAADYKAIFGFGAMQFDAT